MSNYADLTPLEARVLACLVEKQVTTPDQYPLSLNALVNACNQKSNRDPVLALTEGEVQRTVDGLLHRHLIVEKSGFGSRVPKYQHRMYGTEYSWMQLTAQEAAILCELMLRGPQTPGELRARASRMAEFTGVDQVESLLDALARRAEKPLAVQLAREPGRRESRHAHLLCGPVDTHLAHMPSATAPAETEAADDRIARLEDEVRQLRTELEELKVTIRGTA